MAGKYHQLKYPPMLKLTIKRKEAGLTIVMILVAWLVEMPLWLSIVITVGMSLRLVWKCLARFIRWYTEWCD